MTMIRPIRRNTSEYESDAWEVACGGNETPFTFDGQTFTYMWNTETKRHAYYNHTKDIFVRDFRTNDLI